MAKKNNKIENRRAKALKQISQFGVSKYERKRLELLKEVKQTNTDNHDNEKTIDNN